MTTSPLRFTLFFVLFLSSLLAGNSQAGDEKAKETIAILPFTANAPKDISYLQSGIRNMLASRLAAEAGLGIIEQARVDQQVAAAGELKQQNQLTQLGSALQADYLLSGVLTSIGKSISLDAKLYPINGAKPVETFYASAATEDDIISAVDSLAWDIAEKSFGKQRPVAKSSQQQGAVSAPTAQQQAPALPTGQGQLQNENPAYRTAHPDRQFMSNSPGGGASPLVYPTAITGTFGFTKTQNLNFSMQGLDIGDIDGDGQQDVVIASRNKIIAYHLVNNRLVPFGEMEIQSRFKIISLELADINGNGKEEIYATGVDWITPDSLGAEWQGKEFTYLFKGAKWYVRPMHVPGPGLMLAGQRSAIDEAFTPGIYQVSVNADTLQQAEKLPVPDSLNLFDFSLADLDGDGKTEVIALDNFDKLKVLETSGKLLWKSDESYGGTLKYVGGEDPAAKTDKETLETRVKNRVYIHSRIIVEDVNNDNLPDIVVNKNLDSASRVLENMKNYPSGEMHALAWNGIGLTDLWRTRKIDGYVASYQMVRNPDTKDSATLYVGLITNSGWFDVFAAKDSTVLIYPLDLSKREAQEQNPQQGYQYMGK
ncbi:MAG: VCBS repeat-containing protein [Deltaproteobacteria bacterium]|nr:VCBS repeat-containing protein [Deltaproteobacteria bacterium]